MNAFYEHHKDSIRFGYRCFDRILLNGLIQPFQQPERVIGFFDTYRHLYPVSRDVLRGAADRFGTLRSSRRQRAAAMNLSSPTSGERTLTGPWLSSKPESRRGS